MRNLLVFVVAVLMGGALVFALSRLKQREAPAATERAPAAVPARAEPEDDSAAQPLHKPAPERERAQPVDETP